MADKELELVVKFTGKLSAELDAAINKLKSTVQDTVKSGTEPLVNSVKKMNDTFAQGATQLKKTEVGLGRIGALFGSVGERITGLIKAQILFYGVQSTLFAVMGQIKDGITSYYELEKKITDMAAITGANADEQKRMSDAAREAGNTTAVSAEEAADAMMLLRQAGYDTTQTIQTLGAVTKGMTTTNESAAMMTDLLTTAMAAWNIPASQAEQVMSDLIRGADLSKLKMSDLKTSFNLAAGTMSNFNFNIKDTLVVLGVLRDRGSAAGTSARALRQALNTLGLAATDVTNVFGKFLRGRGVNLDLLDVTKSTFDFADAMDELKSKGISSAEIMKYFSANAREVMLKTIDAGDAIREYGNRFDKLPSLQQRFDTAMGSTINQLKLLRNNFTDLVKTLVTNYNPNVQEVIKWTRQLVDALKVMAGDATEENIDKIRRMGLAWVEFTKILIATYTGISIFFTGLYSGFTTLYAAIQLSFGAIYKQYKLNEITGYQTTLMRLVEAGQDTTEIMKKLTDAQADYDAAVVVSSGIADNYIKDMEKYSKRLQETMDKAAASYEGLTKRPVLGPFKADYLKKAIESALANIKIRVPVKIVPQVSKETIDTLKLEIKALELKEDYGEKWIEKKTALYELELIQDNVFANDKKAIDEAVQKYKEKLYGEDSIQEKKRLDESISREQSVADAKKVLRDKDTYERIKKYDDDKQNEQKDAENRIKLATNFWDRLVALMAKDDLKKPFEEWADYALSQVNKISDGIGTAFANAIVEGENLKEALDKVWKGIASDLIRELTSEALKSVIRNLFKDTDNGGVDWMGLIGTVLNWFSGSSTGSNLEVHSGGYVKDAPSFHSGGLNANEVMAKLRTDEFVMGPMATKKIGVNNLDEINRTGQLAGQQERPQVQVPVQIINVADPNEIAKYLIENPNIIINAIVRDKRFHGEIKRMIQER